MSSIFEYLDYREYLKDFYERSKREKVYFTYRHFSEKVGLDASYLAKVIIKTRHIAEKSISAFTECCNLKGKESEYFENLVHFAKAKSDRQSKLYFEKLLSLKGVSSATITEDQYEFYRKWYHAALRSILEFYEFKGNYRDLGEQLSPPVSAKEAKESVRLLQRLGLITMDKDGRMVLSDKAVTTGPEWHSLAVSNFQEEVIGLARESLTRHNKEIRDISTVTMNINEKDFQEIQDRIRSFRESIIQYVDGQKDPDRVYHLNLQLVPLTRIKEKEE